MLPSSAVSSRTTTLARRAISRPRKSRSPTRHLLGSGSSGLDQPSSSRKSRWNSKCCRSSRVRRTFREPKMSPQGGLKPERADDPGLRGRLVLAHDAEPVFLSQRQYQADEVDVGDPGPELAVELVRSNRAQ